MDYDDMPTLSEAHPETMDLLSRAWCDFAVKEALQPEFQSQALVLHDYAINSFDDGSMSPNFKSWIWMQQAMHPEVNYSSCFRKKLQSWHVNPFKSSHLSIKKWLKEIKQKKKENERLQNAEVHAAISVAGVAAALAAIAAENSNHGGSSSPSATKEAAVATAAALVAAQCAKNAEAMGAKKHQIRTAMSSAMSATSTSDILTLTAAASTCNS
ncbi:putative VAN3-binding protein [Helianthus annuus]|nr:putative VAN3-binding protein [Helianthus annuus]